MTESRQAHLWMLGTVALWGWTFVVVKGALADISPLLFNLARFIVAFLCLAAVYGKHWKRLTRRAWAGGAVVGVFLAIGFQFQTAGLRLTTPSKSAFLTGVTVVLTPLLAALPGLRMPGSRPPRWNVWLGALLAFAGIMLLTAPTGAVGAGGILLRFLPANKGDLLTLACAFGFALMIIAQDRFSRSTAKAPFLPPVPFEQLALLQLGFGTVFVAISTPFFEKPHFHASRNLAAALLITAFMATAAAFTVQSWAQHRIPPAHLALILALEPVFAWLAALILLKERLSERAALGACLVMAGIGAAECFRSTTQAKNENDQSSWRGSD